MSPESIWRAYTDTVSIASTSFREELSHDIRDRSIVPLILILLEPMTSNAGKLTDPILHCFDILCVLQDIVDLVANECLACFVTNRLFN